MAKQLQAKVTLPIVEMLTPDEAEEAFVRFVLYKKGILEPDTSKFASKVGFRNVRLPDGSLAMFVAVAVLNAPVEESRKAVDTPVPEKNDG
jgi:hypothetical protein